MFFWKKKKISFQQQSIRKVTMRLKDERSGLARLTTNVSTIFFMACTGWKSQGSTEVLHTENIFILLLKCSFFGLKFIKQKSEQKQYDNCLFGQLPHPFISNVQNSCGIKIVLPKATRKIKNINFSLAQPVFVIVKMVSSLNINVNVYFRWKALYEQELYFYQSHEM